jgi:hypothetical protein
VGKRGRTSAAALTIAGPKRIEVVDRQKAPHDLNDEETEVWAAVVNAEPADWFSASTVPVLAQYCRHVVNARRIAELKEKATSDPELSVSDYNGLLAMERAETRIIAALARTMRLTQQSTTNHRGNKRPNPARKPWES